MTLWTAADAAMCAARVLVSSVFPMPFRALAAAAESGDAAAIASAQAGVDDVVNTIGGDIGSMKAVSALLGVSGGRTRMAIEPPSAEVSAELPPAVERHA